MTVIRIRQDRVEAEANIEDTFHGTIDFDHGAEYPITVSRPFADEQEQELE